MGDMFDKFSDKNELDHLRRKGREEEWQRAIDRVVDEAQQKGMFDNLPGQGKPLNLRKNPYAGDQALAYELLQNNDYTLPWIAERNELLAKIDALRGDLLQAWQRQQREMAAANTNDERYELRHEWRRYLTALQAQIERLNKKITHANLSIPSERLEILKLNLDRELQRIGAERE